MFGLQFEQQSVFFSNLFFCKKQKKMIYLKKKSFCNIEDIYNIIQVLQCKINHMFRSREAFHIWLYTGLLYFFFFKYIIVQIGQS